MRPVPRAYWPPSNIKGVRLKDGEQTGGRLSRIGRVAALCALLLALALNPTNFRLELVFVPLVAIGLALGFERAVAALREVRPRPVPAEAAR